MVDDQTYQRVVAEIRAQLAEGTNLNALLRYMKNEGFTIFQAIRAVHEIVGRLDIAKTFTATSTAYRDDHDSHEPFHRELVEALTGTQPEQQSPGPSDAPQRELADLRAALARTLRLYHRTPGPEGLTPAQRSVRPRNDRRGGKAATPCGHQPQRPRPR